MFFIRITMIKHFIRSITLFFIFSTYMSSSQIMNPLSKPLNSPTPWLRSRENFIKKMPKNSIVAEIGVQAGNFSEMILKYTNPKHLYLIDCWKQSTSHNNT